MAFRSAHSIKYKKNASPRGGTIMNIKHSIKSGSQMRNACFHHPSPQDSVFLHWCCLNHTLQSNSGLWCTYRGGASSLTLLQCLSSLFLAHSGAHTGFAPVGLPRHHVPDDKPKSNFKVGCSHFSSVWIWLFSYKHGTFLSQAWRRGAYKVLWLFFEKENLPYFCPILASNRVQKQLPK